MRFAPGVLLCFSIICVNVVHAQNFPSDSIASLALRSASEYTCTFNKGVRLDQNGGVAARHDISEQVSFVYKPSPLSGQPDGTLRGQAITAERENVMWGYLVVGIVEPLRARDSSFSVRVFPVFSDNSRNALSANLHISEQSADLVQRQSTIMAGFCFLK